MGSTRVVMPPRARRYIAVVACTGVATGLLTWVTHAFRIEGLAEFAVIVLLVLAAGMVPVRFMRDDAIQGFTLEGGVFVAALFTLPLGVVPAVMILASAIAHGTRSRDLHKTLFNAGRTGLETSAGVLVFTLLDGEPAHVTTPRAVLMAALAALVYEAVSASAMTELFHRLSGVNRRRAFQDVTRLSVITYVGNTSYGIMLAALVTVSAWIGALSGVLLLGLFFGYRGFATALTDRRRAESLNAISHRLMDVSRIEHTLPAVLQMLAHEFGSGGGQIVVTTSAGLRSFELGAEDLDEADLRELPRTGVLARAIASNAGIVDSHDEDGVVRDAIAAPVRQGEQATGALALWGRRGLEPWDDADANLLAAIANEVGVAIENVTLFEQVEAERRRLEAESNKLTDILEAAGDGIALISADGRIEEFNPGFARIAHVVPEDAVGRHWHEVLALSDDNDVRLAPVGDHFMNRSLAGERFTDPHEFTISRIDGSRRALACTASPVEHGDGPAVGMVLVARDVTHQRELDNLKSDFIATVSHELRTPLTPLKGFVSTLRTHGDRLSSEQRDSVTASMDKQLSRLEALVSDLLAVAELDSGEFSVRAEAVRLEALVRQAVAIEVTDAGRCSVEIVADEPADADPVAVVRVLRALISNAFKHTTEPFIVRLDADDDHVRVQVIDNGPGIATGDQSRIFGRFERLGDHLTRSQGPGLGLTIARSLAARMGGEVELTSAFGQGSTFELRLRRPILRRVTAPAEATGA